MKPHDPLIHASIVLALFTSATAPAFADQAMAQKNGCMTCHGIDKKIVGPAYKDVAAKYKGDAKALAHLETVIHKGGQGVWGKVPMPPQTSLSERDARTLAQWVLSQ